MTGRDLIIYILANNLENEQIAKDGRFLNFKTAGEVAAEKDVGVATVWVWVAQGKINGVQIGDTVYIPA